MLNYQIQSKETSILEMINLLKTVEPTLQNEAKIMMLVDSSVSKKGSKNKKKKKAHESKGRCNFFHCGQDGHKRRNCKAYLGSLKKKASNAPSTSCLFIIEVNTISHNNQWVLDTKCGSHICTNV